ncbi:MAG: energy transducer TonB [bacterium]
MVSNNYNSYMPYGAYELKATYQRNMLIGMASVTTLVITILLTVALYSIFKPNIIMDSVIPFEGDDGIAPKPTIFSIVHQTPQFNSGSRREIIADVGIPTPVADSLFADDDMTIIASNEELAILNGSGNGPFTGNDNNIDFGNGGNGSYYGVGEEITPTTFVKVEEPPVMIKEYVPKYPRLCEIAGITGTVWIWALVDENGKVIKAEVIKSSENQALDEAALMAAYKNIFKPGIQNKRPIKVGVTYKVEFILDD